MVQSAFGKVKRPFRVEANLPGLLITSELSLLLIKVVKADTHQRTLYFSLIL